MAQKTVSALPTLITNRNENEAPTIASDGATTPAEYLSLFLDDTMLTTVCVHTNTKINQLKQKYKIQDNHTTKHVGLMELKGLLGIIILTGVKNKHIVTTEMWSYVR